MPVWSRLPNPGAAPDGQDPIDAYLHAGLADRGVEPMVYMTTSGVAYEDIIAGLWDDHLESWGRQVAAIGQPLVLRLDQEPNGAWAAPWSLADPTLYRRMFGHVERAIRSYGGARNVRMLYCPVWRGRDRADDFERYYPGDACQLVGFDSYAREDEPIPLARRWRAPLETLRRLTPDKGVVVGEYGILRGIAGRRRWLRGLREVDGIETAVYMDMDLDHLGRRHLWALSPGMRRDLGAIIRGDAP